MPNRVLQLDASLLDGELFRSLKEKLSDAFSDPSLSQTIQRVATRYSGELALLLKLVLFKYTIWDKGTTYGLKLQNLRLHDAHSSIKNPLSKSRRLLLLATIVGSYLYNKLQSVLYSSEESSSSFFASPKMKALLRCILPLMKKLQRIYVFLSLGNFLAFLIHGIYPSLTNRILGISYTPLSMTQVSLTSNPETISYEFQDRQLIWNTLTEFLAFTLPLLSLRKLSVRLEWLVKHYSTKKSPTEPMFRFLPESCCAICYQESASKSIAGQNASVDDNMVTNPYITNCGHVYCYYCLSRKLAEFSDLNGGKPVSEEEANKTIDDGTHWLCLRCGKPVVYCMPYEGGCGQYLKHISDEKDTQNKSIPETDVSDDESSDNTINTEAS